LSLSKRVVAAIVAIPVIVVGSRVPLPGVNVQRFVEYWSSNGKPPLLSLYDMVFQGGLYHGAVLALGIMPYLSARLYLWLWRKVNPAARATRMKTRVLTGALAVLQSVGLATFLQRIPGVVANPGAGFIASTVLTLTAGSLVVMWLGEQLAARDDDDDVLPLPAELGSGNFAHATEPSAVRPQPDGIQR